MDSDIQLRWQQETVICHSQRLMQSFHYWTARCLVDADGSPQEIAQALFDAPFVLVSHGTHHFYRKCSGGHDIKPSQLGLSFV